MFEFKIDVTPFEDEARRMNAAADQMPFALSRALNDAANETYESLIENTWTKAVKVRNPNFLRWSLKTKFSTKHDLCVEIYDQKDRGHLALHADGGVKVGNKQLAIPTSNVQRGERGVVANQRPSVLTRKVVKGNLIFQATGNGKGTKLKLMYVLARQANQPKDVPFREDFADMMQRSAEEHFSERMMEAMRTRR